MGSACISMAQPSTQNLPLECCSFPSRPSANPRLEIRSQDLTDFASMILVDEINGGVVG